MMTRTTQQIDREYDALIDEMRRVADKDLETSTDWQKAWDNNPILHAKQRALILERHEARIIKRKRVDQLLAKRDRRKEKTTTQPNTEVCPTCHGAGWLDKLAA